MQPRFETLGEFKVIGMRYFGKNQNDEIPGLWDKFVPRMGEITQKVNPDLCYGLCIPNEDTSQTGEFEYIAGFEVDNFDDIPVDMVCCTIPAQRYAVFTHKGHVSKLKDTFAYIFDTWQKESGASITDGPEFELYDERFCPQNQDESELDIYVPIRE